MKEAMGMTFKEFTEENQIGLFLQPLTDIHLSTDFSIRGAAEQGGDMKSVYIFWCKLLLFMLLIACINFYESFYGFSNKKSKEEVGIRKVFRFK